MRLGLLLALIIVATAAGADEAFRDDFQEMVGWQARPDWLAPASQAPGARAEGGIGLFTVPEPARGMKWLKQLDEAVDIELTPWLVFRYKTTNYDVAKPDYVVYLKDAHKEGMYLVKGDGIKADGQWHTRAVNLLDAGVESPVTQVAVQCYATAAGQATLALDYLTITDLPPGDAEGYQAPATAGREWPVQLDSAKWKHQPAWLGNPCERSACEASPAGVRFCVPEGMAGGKFSHELPEPVTGAQWVAMRYRMHNTAVRGEYALYVASAGGGAAPQEGYALQQSDLTGDGAWHVAIGRVTIPTVHTLAVQVQAARDDAWLEVAALRFTESKPAIAMADVFDGTAGWPADMKGWQPLTLPAGNLAGVDLSRRLGMQGWIAEGKVTSSGVPFTVRPGQDAVIMTPVREPGQIAVALAGKAAEVYLLLAAQFPRRDEPSYAGTAGFVKHLNRLAARIEYADGTAEEQFPFAVNARQHAVSRSLQTYALALDPTRALKRLVLTDSMKQGAFGLVAVTLSSKAGPATEATRPRPALSVPRAKPVEARAAGIKRVGDLLSVSAWTVSMTLDLSHGVKVASILNTSGVGVKTSCQPGPLFRVVGKGFEVNSTQFTVDRVTTEPMAQGQSTRLDLTCTAVQPALGVSVWVDVTEPREIGLRGRITLNGHDPAETRFIFPEVGGLTMGGTAADMWIWCPRRGDVITDNAVSLREPYAGAGNPFQIVGAFDPRQGTGLYLMTEDLEGTSKFYQAQKSNEGARLAVEFNPLHDAELPRIVLGCNQGDWHEQLERYREWLATWYQAAAPRKPWFQQVFNFRQHFINFAVPTNSGMFDPATKTFKFREVVDADAAAFGGVDYLHLFDWGWDPVHGRCGDYVPWDYLGGADNFRRAVEQVKAGGTPVGLYLEGILVDPQSNLGKAHGEAWQMLGAGRQPYPYFAPSFHVCPRVPEWQDYLSDTYKRVRAETGAQGFYIDEYGFAGTSYWCYNPKHGHPVPVTPVVGERGMLQKVRAKLGPDAVIYTEESPVDVNSQYQDGSFTYNISSASDEACPSHVNLYRFALPEFKTIEIICCDQPLGTNVEAVKRCLFNGEAIWIEGTRDEWFVPETRAQIALNHRVMRENRQCFTSSHVRALVPTLLAGAYANQFGERADLLGKTCWTIYNTNYRTMRGEVIAVDHAPGAQYLDEISGKPLKARIVGKTAYLTLEIAPRDVVVISRGLFVR